MNILFWNLNKKDLTDVIKEIAEKYDIDIFVFCEYAIDDYKFITSLNNQSKIFNEVENYDLNRLKVFSSIDTKKFKPLEFSDFWGIYEVERTGYPKFILTTVHLPSKMWFTSDSQSTEIEFLSDDIKESVDKTNNKNVVLLGDFNVNPFEKGMITTKGLHSTMDKRIALTGGRKVQNRFFEFYYNPMWNFLGFSPSLVNFINIKDIEIVIKTKSFNLVNNNARIDKKYSDHLPLKFTINNNAK